MAATVATSVASLCTAFRAQASVSCASPSALTCRAGPVRRSVLSRGTSSPAACRPVSRALGFSSAVAGQKVELSSSAPAAATAAASRTLAARAKAGYKMKTHKASAKRFRVTGSGKVVRRNAWRAHLLRKKSTKRKNRLAGTSDVFRGDLDKVIGALPYLKVNRNRTP